MAMIKHRKCSGPFCSVDPFRSHTGEYFEIRYASPFMTHAYSVRPAKSAMRFRAHSVDGSGQAGQTVTLDANPR